MKHRWLFVGIFVITMLLSICFLFVNPTNNWGTKAGIPLNLGVDFTGGTKIYFPVSRAVSSDEVAGVLNSVKGQIPALKFNAPQPSQNPDSSGVMRYKVLIYTNFLNDAEQNILVKSLTDKFGSDAANSQGLQITRIDPLIGKELVDSALWAVLIASVLMIIYIWFRFELMSGIAGIIALLHDCILVLGAFALFEVEVNSTIIAALLTVLGYSINDTIVVFDRIRENVKYRIKGTSFVEVVNDSILETFRRSLNTSFTTILAILVIFVAVPNVRELCFGLIVGITSGTYSSIFIASPIWAIYKDWQENKKQLNKPATATR
jgi:preprotein translocase subunit SecF